MTTREGSHDTCTLPPQNSGGPPPGNERSTGNENSEGVNVEEGEMLMTLRGGKGQGKGSP